MRKDKVRRIEVERRSKAKQARAIIGSLTGWQRLAILSVGQENDAVGQFRVQLG